MHILYVVKSSSRKINGSWPCRWTHRKWTIYRSVL